MLVLWGRQAGPQSLRFRRGRSGQHVPGSKRAHDVLLWGGVARVEEVLVGDVVDSDAKVSSGPEVNHADATGG